jgi:hypothetical protein
MMVVELPPFPAHNNLQAIAETVADMAGPSTTRRVSTGPATSGTKKKPLASAAFQKQLQTSIAIGCMTYVYTLEQMKLQQVQQKLFDSFHANPTAKDCLKGENAFALLWDSCDGSESRNPQLTLKYCFTQRDHVTFFCWRLFYTS